MKIVVCHNYYQEPGGEDQSFNDEACLLEARGHEVIRFMRHNDAIKQMSSAEVALRTVWNRQTTKDLGALLRRERPSIVHFTNTFPLISPAAYYVARREGAKTIQSLRNYRLLCPNAYFLRDGKVCEDCLGKLIAWPAVRHGCYRGDRRATAVVAGMLAFHRAIGTYSRVVDLFYALTEFGRRKFIEGGLPPEKIAVKPNFMHVDPGPGKGEGDYAVFVGRLSPEKGLDTLLAAWKHPEIQLPLTIVGDGPLRPLVQEAASQNPKIRWVGHQPPARVREIIGSAKFLVLSSILYEGLPKTIVEAYSKGTPVVGSNLGAMTEVIEDGRTGVLFRTGDVGDLACAVKRLIANPQELAAMRVAARRAFEETYTADANYEILMGLYETVLGRPIERTPVERTPGERTPVETPSSEPIPELIGRT